jgi:hypothetical protein
MSYLACFDTLYAGAEKLAWLSLDAFGATELREAIRIRQDAHSRQRGIHAHTPGKMAGLIYK